MRRLLLALQTGKLVLERVCVQEGGVYVHRGVCVRAFVHMCTLSESTHDILACGWWGGLGCQVFEVSFVQSGRRLSRLGTRPLPRQLVAPHISAASARGRQTPGWRDLGGCGVITVGATTNEVAVLV